MLDKYRITASVRAWPEYRALVDALREPLAAIGVNVDQVVWLKIGLDGIEAEVFKLNQDGHRYVDADRIDGPAPATETIYLHGIVHALGENTNRENTE